MKSLTRESKDHALWNGVVNTWTGFQLNGHDFLRKQAVKSLKERFASHNIEQVLDIGCGAGVFTNELRTIFPNVTGIDASGGMIEVAKKHFNEKRGLYFFEDDSVVLSTAPTGFFNLAVSLFTMQNIARYDEVFKQVDRVCTREGRFVLYLYYPGKFQEKFKPFNASFKKTAVMVGSREVKVPMLWNFQGMKRAFVTNVYFRPLQQYLKVCSKKFYVEALTCWDEGGVARKLEDSEEPRIVEICLRK